VKKIKLINPKREPLTVKKLRELEAKATNPQVEFLKDSTGRYSSIKICLNDGISQQSKKYKFMN